MPGKGKLVLGIILILAALGLLIGASLTAAAYAENLDTHEKNKDYLDSLTEGSAEYNEKKEIYEDEGDTLQRQEMIMGACFPLGIISIIVGIFFIIDWKKSKKIR